MYEEIAKEMRHKLRKNVTAINCENKWRVLERAYKKYIADTNQTGAGRKEFEYAEIMTEILGKKRNVHPEILLAADTVDNMPSTSEESEPSRLPLVQTEEEVPKRAFSIKKKTVTTTTPLRSRNLKTYMLKEIRSDRQSYYKQRLEQEERKIEQKLRKNKLLEEKNLILKQIAEKLDPRLVNVLDA